MPKLNKQTVIRAAGVVLLITVAVLCRQAWRVTGTDNLAYNIANASRSGIYIGLIAVWGVSLHQRILQKQVRFFLLAVCGLLLFWFSDRTVKFLLVSDNNTIRYLWYLYYIPLLFIPLLGVLISLSLGKPEEFRLPRWTAALYVPAAVLLILVLTNDLHQAVFLFPEGEPWTDSNRSYSPGYIPVLSWEIICSVVSIALMIYKCRAVKGKRLLLPFVPMFGAIIYAAVWITGIPALRLIAGDLTATQCLFYMAVFESCIQCGLIRSNTHYKELFHASTIGAQITDCDYNVLLSSASAKSFPTETLRLTGISPVMTDSGLRLSGAPIRGGYVAWQEDVSQLQNVIDELEQVSEELKDKNAILAEEYRTRHKRQMLAEKNRLYNKVQSHTQKKTGLLAEFTAKLAQAQTSDEIGKLISHIAVLTVYIKRRNNLIFIAEENGSIPARELEYCLRESIINLNLSGTECRLHVTADAFLPSEQAAFLYDSFEAVIELALDGTEQLFVSLGIESGNPVINMNIICSKELYTAANEYTHVEREAENEWMLCLSVPQGGDYS